MSFSFLIKKMVTVTVVTVLFCHIYILSRILMSHPQDSDSVLNIRFSKRKVERILKNSSDICSFTHFLLLLHKINCTRQSRNKFPLRSIALSLQNISSLASTSDGGAPQQKRSKKGLTGFDGKTKWCVSTRRLGGYLLNQSDQKINWRKQLRSRCLTEV